VKKRILLLVFFIGIISACEKDDFCIENPVTSKLIINFYDDTNRETLKKVERFSMIAVGVPDSLFTNVSTESSISIPLNSLTNETVFKLKKNTTTNGAKADNLIATFTITYDKREEFVSRSCGFKVLYSNVAFSSDTNSWITDFTPTTVINLDDQSEAHVQIYH
jgi:hypothetical protein